MSVISLFMCGDVMTGRGIDQILPHPGNPVLHESFVKRADQYVLLAEEMSGRIPTPVDFAYIWGDALKELEQFAPDVRIINLETAVTGNDEPWPEKEVNYRMNPENIACLSAAKIDCCSLANNHIIDWGYAGLIETLDTLKSVDIRYAGAGRNLKDAEYPAMMEIDGKGRVIVFSFGSETSGIPPAWEATDDRPGVCLLRDLSSGSLERIKGSVQKVKQVGDVVVASIHWGGNWGYDIPQKQIEFAHALIDEAGVDLIHGHSSHHVKGIEGYNDKLIIYGCGDFIDDYEGIAGYEDFRGDLGLMYFAGVDAMTGKLSVVQMIPTQIRRLRVNRASEDDAVWLMDVLNREGKRFGTRVSLNDESFLELRL